MKTRAEIENLKAHWRADPCFDLETWEGFEEHAAELLEFRLKCEAEWNQRKLARLADRAKQLGVPGNISLAEQWELMEYKISELQDKFDRHDDNHPQPAKR